MNPTPKTSSAALRIIWGALLMGQAMFFFVIVMTIWPNHQPRDAHQLQTLFYIELAALVSLVPVGFFIRNSIHNRGRDERGNISATAYATGNIVFWAMCESASFLGLVGAMQQGGPWPHLIVTIIAVAMQLITFPTGAQQEV